MCFIPLTIPQYGSQIDYCRLSTLSICTAFCNYCLVQAYNAIDHTLPLIVKDNFHGTNQIKPLQAYNHAAKYLETDIPRITAITC